MAVSIVDHRLADGTHNRYDVTFFGHRIPTLLTHSPSLVSSWLSRLLPSPLLVGLDVEWRPNFAPGSDHPIATIHLCAASSSSVTCLIFQILYAPRVPLQLAGFLANPANKFVGVGIAKDAEKLMVDYGLRVGNVVDLRELTGKEMKNAGLKTLAKEVLGKEVEKPKKVSMSRWDNPCLTLAQVQYACLDAFLSFEIGRSLTATASSAAGRDAALVSGIEAAAFHVKTGGCSEPADSRAGARKKATCDHCGKPGHTRSVCWQLHGHPSWNERQRLEKGKGAAVARGANAWGPPRKSNGGPPPSLQLRQKGGTSAHYFSAHNASASSAPNLSAGHAAVQQPSTGQSHRSAVIPAGNRSSSDSQCRGI